MDILKEMLGHTVKVFTSVEFDREQYIEGILKRVDSHGVLIQDTSGFSDNPLVYIKHVDYQQISVIKTVENMEGIFSAFKQKKNRLFDVNERL